MRPIFSCGRRTAAVLASLALAAAVLPLTACGSTSSGGDDSAIKAVASTTQICDYITQLASDGQDDGLSFDRTGADGTTEHFGADTAGAKTHLTLTCLLAPNASAHEHDMTAEQSRALSEADLFFVSGVDLEHFLDDAVTSTGFKGSMVVTSGVAGAADVDDLDAQLAKEKELPYTVDRGTTKVDVATWPFPPEDGESEPEFRFDPHVWTSPKNAAIQVANIGAALEEAAPGAADQIRARTEAYAQRIEALDSWAAASLESVPQSARVLFTSHDAFGYFSKAYGITFIGAALSDFNEQQDATASHIDAAVRSVKESGARALFAENSNNSKSIEAIAKAAGVKAVVGEDALYGDSLGPAGSPGSTYTGSIVHNVTTIVEAWDGTLAPLPDGLGEGQ